MAGQRSDPSQAASGRVRTALLASGLRWRARSSIAMLVVAAVGVGAAAFGPMYVHATDQVVLDSALDGAPAPQSGLTLVRVSGYGYPSRLVAAARAAPQPERRGSWFGRPIVTQFAAFVTATTAAPPGGASTSRTTLTFVPRPGRRLYLGTLVSRTGVCAHLTFVAGSCALGKDGVVVSNRTAQALGLQVGGRLHLGFVGSERAASVVVVGVYAPGTPDEPYWWEQDFFPFGTFSAASAYEHLDDVFAAASAIRSLVPVRKIYPVVQVPFDRGSLSVDAVGRFEGALAAYQHLNLGAGTRIGTRLDTLLARAAGVERVAAAIVAVVDLELALLAVFVLYFVASRTAAERQPDVRLSELRGFRARSTLAVALAEPVVIVVAAVPVGFLAAWAVAALVAPAVFGRGIGVLPTALGAGAAGAAGVVGVLAAAFGARRGIVAGDGPPGSGGGIATGSRWSAAADAVVVAVAAGAFFELVVAGDAASGSHPLAALAPGLLAVAFGVLACRALPRLLRLTHRRSAFSARAPLVLATRLVARRREFAGQLLVVTVSVAIATFSLSAWAVATTNRDLRASFGVGAATVLTVSVRPGTTFLSAVRAADPTGHDAMAAVVEHSHGATTLAVDARRMAAVVTWPKSMGMPVAQVAHRLVPSHLAPPVMLEGTAAEVVVDMVSDPALPPDLEMDLFDTDTQTLEQVTFGPLRPGSHAYRGSLSFLCTGGCRLVDLAVSRPPAASGGGAGASSAPVSLEVRSMAERSGGGRWAVLRAGLRDAARWTSPSGGVRLTAGGAGLTGAFALPANGTPVTVAPRDVPPALPVVVTPAAASSASGDGGPLVVGLDGATIPGRTVGEVPALPGVGAGAVLADLHTAELFLSGPFTYDVPEVWLSRTAPAAVVRRLAARGVAVVGTTTAAAARRGLARDGISLAYLLYLVSGVATGLLLVGATAFATASVARRRRSELAALRAVGISGRTLRHAVALEQVLVLGAGVAAGAAAGLGAAAVALRSVPEFASPAGGLPLDLGLPPVVVAVDIAAIVLALAAVSLWSARALVAGATVERLGTAQD